MSPGKSSLHFSQACRCICQESRSNQDLSHKVLKESTYNLTYTNSYKHTILAHIFTITKFVLSALVFARTVGWFSATLFSRFWRFFTNCFGSLCTVRFGIARLWENNGIIMVQSRTTTQYLLALVLHRTHYQQCKSHQLLCILFCRIQHFDKFLYLQKMFLYKLVCLEKIDSQSWKYRFL